MSHARPRLTPWSRLLLVERVLAGRPAAHVAAEMGVSRATAYKWLARYRADVGVTAGRIATIGRIRESAREVIDAEGRVVSPGFVDGHTHMDAQVFWDPLGTSSCWHGITSVVMGNCGFTLAPCAAKDRHLVVKNLQRAEDISLEAMQAGTEWRWTTYPEFLDELEAPPQGINYPGLTGHSAPPPPAMER